MQLPLAVNRHSTLNLQTQVFEQIRSMILAGQLRSGQRLPSSRHLCQQLQVSRITITLAFARLADEGYVETAKSLGTFVSREIPEQALHALRTGFEHTEQPIVSDQFRPDLLKLRSHNLVNARLKRSMIDFWVGRPDARSFPLRTWTRLTTKRLLSAGSALTEYRDPTGFIELRQAIADHLRPARGIIAEAEQIIITGGCQEGLNLVCRMLLSAGTDAIVESPGYAGASYLFESFGAHLHQIRVDEKGLDVAQLPDVTNALAYVTPSHQYPMGCTLPLDRRLELLAWAVKTNSYVVEDDYDSDFRYVGSPLAALKALDRANRVFYVGTFSKCLGAGLRIGYVVVPPAMLPAARHYKALMNNGQPWLEQAVLADFMNTGGYARHLRTIRQHYLGKRDALLRALNCNFGQGRAIGAEGGMHLAWRIPAHLPVAPVIVSKALEYGVGVYDLSPKAAVSPGRTTYAERHLMFGYSSLTEKQITTGVERLAASLRTQGASDMRPIKALSC
ncbi:PLP-dependent aminotransferase family protein [Hyphomicrobium denitrificans]|uniref:MocR-like pyridoxine biosynthesis transcription factor PdxR n=1 Tax=Hyphomicrobium denitrificans TaxID=53399 RepID=UPI00022E2AFC|nr:PLP-dependent aminotransferase family protein [Hyphomicrobium denitrificans]